MQIIETEKVKPHPLNVKIYGDNGGPELIDSIRNKGILTPLLVTYDYRVISGHRRLSAAKRLQLKTVPVIVSDMKDELDIEEAIIVTNNQREKSGEQIGREYEHLKVIEAERAKKRQAENALRNQPQNTQKSADSEISLGESRQLAAAKIGVSHDTAKKAADIVKTIDELEKNGDRSTAQDIRETLNHQSVNAAYKKAAPIIKANAPAKPTQDRICSPPKSTFNRTNDIVTGKQIGRAHV